MSARRKTATAAAPTPSKRRKMSHSSNQEPPHDQSPPQAQPEEASSSSSESSGWSDEVIEPAIKTMKFRARRGTRMKELMKGKPKNDMFWNRYQGFFGGGLDDPEDEDDQEDYEASSSGRDEFDSDFDLTDSYAGKRGRKKGSKVNNKRKKAAAKDTARARGSKKKPESEESEQKRDSCQEGKNQLNSTSECALKAEHSAGEARKRKMELCSEREDNESSQQEQENPNSKDKSVRRESSPMKMELDGQAAVEGCE